MRDPFFYYIKYNAHTNYEGHENIEIHHLDKESRVRKTFNSYSEPNFSSEPSSHIFSTNDGNLNVKWCQFPISLSNISTFMLIMSYFLELLGIIQPEMRHSEEFK